MKISVVGGGYVGLVTGACLADLGHKVTIINTDPGKDPAHTAEIIAHAYRKIKAPIIEGPPIFSCSRAEGNC